MQFCFNALRISLPQTKKVYKFRIIIHAAIMQIFSNVMLLNSNSQREEQGCWEFVTCAWTGYEQRAKNMNVFSNISMYCKGSHCEHPTFTFMLISNCHDCFHSCVELGISNLEIRYLDLPADPRYLKTKKSRKK